MIEEENSKIRILKKQAQEYEIQKIHNIRTIQGEYSEFLNNQMKEKSISDDLVKQEKEKLHQDIRTKFRILEEHEKSNQIERLKGQIEYRGILQDQERFRNQHPERALKINESPQRSEGSSKAGMLGYGGNARHSLQPTGSASSLRPQRQIPSQDIEPVGPVNANIGHKSNYIPPNPILAPVSDPLYNPYVRREVTNSLHDPGKKSIYIPPKTIAAYNQMSNIF